MCPRTTGLISATRWTASNRAARRSAHSARSCKPCDNKCRSGRLNRFFLAGHLGVILRDVGAVSGKVVTTFHGYDIRFFMDTTSAGGWKGGPAFIQFSDDTVTVTWRSQNTIALVWRSSASTLRRSSIIPSASTRNPLGHRFATRQGPVGPRAVAGVAIG